MVVEDEQDLACLFEDYLRRCGFYTISFTNPADAIAHFEQNPFSYSLVLVDLIMPNMDGIRVSKRIRKLNDTVRIILVTAYYMHEMIHDTDFKYIRFSKVLIKPLKP